MVVGKQPDDAIIRWFPGESDGVDGSGVTITSSPSASNVEELDTTTSGYLVALNDATATLDDRVDTLSARIVASGVLPTGV